MLVASQWLSSDSSASSNTDTLLSYLKFDGDTNDSSGDSNNGTATGTDIAPALEAASTNFLNTQSYLFNGSDDVVTIADAAELSPAAVTVSAWIKPGSLSGGTQTVVAKWDTSSQQEYVLQISDNDVQFYIGDGASVALDSIFATDALVDTNWHHIAGSYDGTNLSVYIDGVKTTDTSTVVLGDSSEDITIGAKPLEDGALFEFFSGHIDDVRIYGRALADGEVSDLAAGNHTTAVWTGAVSSDYELAGNWDIGVLPDPYTIVSIADTANRPVATADVSLAGLTISSGAHFNLDGWNLTINDGGTFDNNGTLQLENSETLSGFTNDTDSGTVLITPTGVQTGLVAGDNYNNLIINSDTLAHWPLDNNGSDVSGFIGDATAVGDAVFITDVPAVNFANTYSASFDGVGDYFQFDTVNIPTNASWCGWIFASADGSIIGNGNKNALAIGASGTEISVDDVTTGSAVWTVSSVLNSWHHICVVQQDMAGVSLALYLDGVQSGSGQPLTTGAPAVDRIGDSFAGRIDDVRIYSRVLSAGEVASLAAGDVAVSGDVQTLSGNLDINGDLILSGGALDVSENNFNITVGGDYLKYAGSLDMKQAGFVLDGSNQQISSSQNFYNLTKDVSAADTLTFGQGSTTAVSNQLSLNGASGQLLSLRSSKPGSQWLLDSDGAELVGYLDVEDSGSLNLIDITSANVTLTGANNTGWEVNIAPNSPSLLGPAAYTDGSAGINTQPTLEFTVSDSNLADELQFQIVIDNSSDFSSPLIDYLSAVGAQGARSFTVGQAAGDGTYNTGTESMALGAGNYYWQVRALDDYIDQHESSYVVANGGAVAFVVDDTPPSAPGTPSNTGLHTDKTPSWSWDPSADSGIGLADPAYTVEWSAEADFDPIEGTDTTNSTSYAVGSELADGIWYFRVKATDQVSNETAWSQSTGWLIDSTSPTSPGAPSTTTPTNDTTPTWTWAASNDGSGGGLATTPYTVEWSQTSNFSEGVSSATSATASFTHTDELADGTWYIRIKAADIYGFESDYSANGQVLVDSTAPSVPGTPTTATPTNDSTPTWSWTASTDAGAGLANPTYTVEWSDDDFAGGVDGTATENGTEFTHADALASGTWYFRVVAEDLLGQASSPSASGVVVVDTSAPDAPTGLSTETPTNSKTPAWTWEAPSDVGVGLADTPYTVEWSAEADFDPLSGTETTADTSFTHSSELADGTWYFRVRAIDKAGNSSDNASSTVLVDTTAPTNPGTPTSADPTNDNTPTWVWVVSTDTGGSGLEDPAYTVQWSNDNFATAAAGSDTTNLDNFTTGTLADGTWYFRVKAADKAGNETDWVTSTGKTVDVDPPTRPGEPSTTTPTNNNLPTWNWDASTDSGTGLDPEDAYTVEWSQASDFTGGTTMSTTSPANSYTHTEALADGTWYFRVRAQDEAGNFSDEYSASGTVLVDKTSPVAPGQPATTTPTTDNLPTWTWAAGSDTGSGLVDPAYTVEWSALSDFSAVEGTSTTNSLSFTHSSELADGTWYFRVKATDKAGNDSDWSATGSVQSDDTPPSVPGAPTTSTPTNDTTPTWSWSASTDNVIGMRNPAYDVQWSQDENFESGVVSDTVNTDEFTVPVLADGTWYFRVRAVDSLNNTSDWSTAGEVLIATGGPTQPGQPTTGSASTTNPAPTWSWAASGSGAGLNDPAYELEWSQDSDFLVGVFTDNTNDANYPHETNLADGTWYFRVRAQDNTLAWSAYSDTGSVLIDTTNPSAPGTPSTASPTAEKQPTWTWSDSTDAGVGLADTPYSVQWSQDSSFNTGVTSDVAASASFKHDSDLIDGTWYFRVLAADKLGNQSAYSANGSVVIDSTGPSAPGTPSTTTPTGDTTPEFTWSASTDPSNLADPAYTVQWSQIADFSAGVTSDTTNDTSYATPVLTDGDWYFRVSATDALGNDSDWSENASVKVDSTAPVAPGVPSAGGPMTNSSTPTWTWDASTDSGSGLANPAYTVEWSNNNFATAAVGTATTNTANFTHGDALATDTWYFRVRAIDSVGNQSGWSGIGSVVIDATTPTDPGPPSAGSSPSTDSTPTWNWDASTDGGFGSNPYKLEWSQDSGFGSGVNNAEAASNSFTHTDALEDGDWYFRVKAVDSAGNETDWFTSSVLNIDASAPTIPGNLSTPTPTNDDTPTWTWDASTDAHPANPLYEYAWADNADFTGATVATTNDTNFTHASLAPGTWHFRVRASDSLGQSSDWATSSVYIDNQPPVISELKATPNPSGVIISWKTDEVASSRVTYGVGATFSEDTTELNTSPRVAEHAVTITGLPACTTFAYKGISIDQFSNPASQKTSSFTTTGCSGNAAIVSQNGTTIGSGGGSSGLTDGSAELSLTIPSDAVTADTEFQIKQLSPAPVLKAINKPSGYSLIGSHIYDLKAANGTSLTTSFDSDLTIEITYTAAEISEFVAGKSLIYRHDGSNWQELSDCVVNTSNRTVTCQTGGFSVFGLFGVLAPNTPEPAPPAGNGTTDPEPDPPAFVQNPKTGNTTNQVEQEGKTEAAEDERGLASTVTKVKNVMKRPAAWISLLVLMLAALILILIRRHRDSNGRPPYGINKD